MTPAPPKIFRDRAIEKSLAEAAAIGVAVLRKKHGRITEVMRKGAVDFVTAADREAEARVLAYLRRRHPDHSMLGEESWDGRRAIPAGFTWILDPLDGTTNFSHGMDHHALSLGLAYDGLPVAGVVVDSARDDWYSAFRGRGARRNKKTIRVSGCARLGDALIATGFPYDRKGKIRELTTLLGKFLERCHCIRRLGVASLDFALVATGHIDGYYEPTLKPWDAAAGLLLVEEAGGVVSNYEGKAPDLFGNEFVAGPPLLHREMIRLIRKTRAELGKGRR